MIRPRHIVLVAALITLAGCNEPTSERRDVGGEGSACLDGGQVRVDFETCLSSSCDTLEDASCTATLDGDTITVTSTGAVVSDVGGTCTTDCGVATTTCQVTGGDASAATAIAYGDQTITDLDCASP